MSIKGIIKRTIRYIFYGIPLNNTVANITYSSPNNKLASKKIIITGGGRGLGAAMASKFIDEGADVLIAGRNKEVLKNERSL